MCSEVERTVELDASGLCTDQPDTQTMAGLVSQQEPLHVHAYVLLAPHAIGPGHPWQQKCPLADPAPIKGLFPNAPPAARGDATIRCNFPDTEGFVRTAQGRKGPAQTGYGTP
jgi:hypothetical protein